MKAEKRSFPTLILWLGMKICIDHLGAKLIFQYQAIHLNQSEKGCSGTMALLCTPACPQRVQLFRRKKCGVAQVSAPDSGQKACFDCNTYTCVLMQI